MSSPFSDNFPSWLLQPAAIQNVFSNQFASLKEVPSYVAVSDYSSFASGLRQALYWRRRLAPSASPNTVILSLLDQQGLFLPSILEVCQALKSVCDMDNIAEFYRAANSSFIGISFHNSQEADKVRSHFLYFHNAIVIHVIPVSSLSHHFKLLWLPPLFPDSRIHHFLSKHSVRHQFIRDLVITDTNTFTPSNSVSGTFELAPSYNISKLPHLIPLPPPHLGSALLIVSGRPSLCLKCGLTGHLRRVCTSPRCTTCHRFHTAHSPCPSSNETSELSIINTWTDDDQLHTSTINTASMHLTAVGECDRTFQSMSSILMSPDPIITPSLVDSHDTTPLDQFHSQSSPFISTMPQTLESAVPFMPISYANIVSSSFPSSIPVSSDSLVSPSITISTSSSISQTSSASLDNHLHTDQSSSKSSSSIKRCHSTLSSSLDPPQIHNASTSNIFSHLVDEVAATSNINSKAVGPKKTSVDTGHSSSFTSSHKRSKFHASPSTSHPTTTPFSALPSTVAPATLWGDSMEGEDVTTPPIIAPLSAPVSHPAASFSDTNCLSQSQCQASPRTLSPNCTSPSTLPSDPLLLDVNLINPAYKDALTSPELEIEEREDDITVSILGFPADTLTLVLQEFAGDPPPCHIFLDHEEEYRGHLFIYRKDDNIQPILQKDGQWVGNSIISASVQQNIDVSD